MPQKDGRAFPLTNRPHKKEAETFASLLHQFSGKCRYFWEGLGGLIFRGASPSEFPSDVAGQPGSVGVSVCFTCRDEGHPCEGPFVQQAFQGQLRLVCKRSFLLSEIESLLRGLEIADEIRSLELEGLQVLSYTARAPSGIISSGQKRCGS